MRLTILTEDGKTIENYLDPNNFQQSVLVGEFFIYLNLLHNREFIKETVQLQENDVHINPIIYHQFNIDAKKPDDEIIPFDNKY